jgi:hypothetical protein
MVFYVALFFTSCVSTPYLSTVSDDALKPGYTQIALGFPLGLEEETEVMPVPEGGARLVIIPSKTGVHSSQCGGGTLWEMEYPLLEHLSVRTANSGGLLTRHEDLLVGVHYRSGLLPVAAFNEEVDSFRIEGAVRMLESQQVQAVTAVDSGAQLVLERTGQVSLVESDGDSAVMGERRDATRLDVQALTETRGEEARVGQATALAETFAREEDTWVEQVDAAGQTLTRIKERVTDRFDAVAQTVIQEDAAGTGFIEERGEMWIQGATVQTDWAEGDGQAWISMARDRIRLVYRRGGIDAFEDFATLFGLDGEGWLEELSGQSQTLGVDEQGLFALFFEEGRADGFFDGEGFAIPLEGEGHLYFAEFGNLITFLAEGRRFSTLWPPGTVKQTLESGQIQEVCVYTRRVDLSIPSYHGSLQLMEIEVQNRSDQAVEDVLVAQSLPPEVLFHRFPDGNNVQPGFSRIYFPPDETVYWRIHRALAPGDSFKAYWVVQTREWYFDPLDPENQPTTMSTQP